MKEGETASVFTLYPGNRLFIMAGAGLPQFLYEEGGFKPTPTAPIEKEVLVYTRVVWRIYVYIDRSNRVSAVYLART